MRFLQRRRILSRARAQDDRLVSAVAGLEIAGPGQFEHGLEEVLALWNDHERSRQVVLFEPASRTLRNGTDVTVTVRSEHASFRSLLENLGVGVDDLLVGKI